ncbi:MAG: hypothetical protein ABSF84_06645 [Acidimicrobiales bacterium]
MLRHESEPLVQCVPLGHVAPGQAQQVPDLDSPDVVMAVGCTFLAAIDEVAEVQGLAGLESMDARVEESGARTHGMELQQAPSDQVLLGHPAVLAGGPIRVDVDEVGDATIGLPDLTKHDVRIEQWIEGGTEQRLVASESTMLSIGRGMLRARRTQP